MKNPQNKEGIMKVSRLLSGIARVGLFLWGAGLIMFLLEAIMAIRVVTEFRNARAIYLVCGGIIEMGLAIFVTLNLLRFLNRLTGGDLFDAKTVSYLAAAGRWWMGYWVTDFAFCIVGNHWFGATMTFSFGHLFTSLIVIFVARLLKEAQEMQEEQSLTV
jgi:hypothetical protein